MVAESQVVILVNGFLVSKEIVVLRRWESETGSGFIKRVDKGWITTFALTKG